MSSLLRGRSSLVFVLTLCTLLVAMLILAILIIWNGASVVNSNPIVRNNSTGISTVESAVTPVLESYELGSTSYSQGLPNEPSSLVKNSESFKHGLQTSTTNSTTFNTRSLLHKRSSWRKNRKRKWLRKKLKWKRMFRKFWKWLKQKRKLRKQRRRKTYQRKNKNRKNKKRNNNHGRINSRISSTPAVLMEQDTLERNKQLIRETLFNLNSYSKVQPNE